MSDQSILDAEEEITPEQFEQMLDAELRRLFPDLSESHESACA